MAAPSPRFPLMDSVRAIAAVTVLCSHTAPVAGAVGPTASSFVRHAAARLDVGVAIFFLISGFLLYRPFVAARLDEAPSPSVGAYAWRRLLRIVPAYWLALTVVALVFHMHDVFTPRGLLAYYGFTQIYSPSTVMGGIGQAWTLDIEITFYAFLPLWALAMRYLARTPGSELRWLGAMFAFSVLWKVAFIAGDNPVHTGRAVLLALPSFLDHFALGMGLAVLSAAWERGRPRGLVVRAVERAPGLAWAFAALAYALVAGGIGLTGNFFEPITPLQYMAVRELYVAVALGIIIPAIVGDPARGFVRRALANPAVRWIGLISYGIYLYHQAVARKFSEWGLSTVQGVHPYILCPTLVLAGASLCAASSYYAFERPILRLKRVVPDHRRSRALIESEPAPRG